MVDASRDALARCGLGVADVDLMIPHQANRRIIDAVARRVEMPAAKVFVNVHRYGNMSAATVPVALAEAVEEGRVASGSRLLLAAFGAGLSWCAHVVRWGDRATPRDGSRVDLPPCRSSGLELVEHLRARRARQVAVARPFIEEARPRWRTRRAADCPPGTLLGRCHGGAGGRRRLASPGGRGRLPSRRSS